MDTDKLKYIVGEAQADKPAIIRFFGPVHFESAQRFNEEFLWLQDYVKPSKIIVSINCDGGSVMYGMSVFSIIQSCPIEVECVVEGIAASMGSVLWAAGTRAYMHDYSVVMIHNPFFKEKDCEDESIRQMVDAFRQQLETVYCRRFGFSKEKARQIMDGDGNADGTFFNAHQAVAAGLIPESHIIKTSKQVCEKVKNKIEGITDTGVIRGIMNSVASEMEENKLPENISAIPKQNEHELQKQQAKKLMEEKEKFSFGAVAAQLGFAEDAPVAGVAGRIADLLQKETELAKVRDDLSALQIQHKGKETEVTNLQASLESANAELKTYRDAEQAAKDLAIATMVDAAIQEGKIEKESKETWVAMAKTNLELTQNTLASIPAREQISKKIAEDPANIQNAQKTLSEVESKIAEEVTKVTGKDFKLQTF
ncbi:MAG: ATP-dependent Clp protease proteolytic subunit [Dysgonamonadaceae bacterium]|jgi:ATP-dependent protease ClpP protease subunit|nr:ATP-dependent Clp protease proteolytic subunit [Dysgonamonadaceae bacterium]